jgi:stage IV sporulation protein FB
MPPLLALSGLGSALLAVAASVLLHEAAHALAARMAGVRVKELLLTPFGGALRIEGLWSFRPGQVAIVALAGPAASLLVMTGAAALAYAGAVPPLAAGDWVRINLMIAAFNLMPALPLDGGRLMTASLGKSLGAAKALRVGVMLGNVLGIAMLALAVWQFAVALKVNLTIVLCALYVLLSGPAEKRSADGAELLSLLARRDELKEEGILPLTFLAADQSVRCQDAMRRLRARRVHRIAVYDDAMHLLDTVEERELIAAVRHGEPDTVGELASKRKIPLDTPHASRYNISC